MGRERERGNEEGKKILVDKIDLLNILYLLRFFFVYNVYFFEVFFSINGCFGRGESW